MVIEMVTLEQIKGNRIRTNPMLVTIMNALSIEQVMRRQKPQFFLSFFFYSKRSLTKKVLNYNINIAIMINYNR